MAVKILHTADWQLGRAFARLPDEAAVPLKQQRFSTIKTIAALAGKHNVDAVLVAGDVFEFETMSDRTLHQCVHAMAAYDGQWLLLPGNHDPGVEEGVWSQLRRLDGLPNNIIILDKAEPHFLPGNNTVVLPAPLRRKHESADITQWFDSYETDEDTIRIGLAHGSVDNRLPDRGEAPNTISDTRAQTARLDYLALGDWHGTLHVGQNTWYSGTHETDRFRDNDSGNVLLTTIEAHGKPPVVEKLRCGHFNWQQLNISVSSEAGAVEIDSALQRLDCLTETLVVQLILKGTVTLETRALIDKVITRWSGRMCFLECNDQALVSQASVDDLDQLGQSGFIAEAVQQLRQLSTDPDNDQRDIADLALQLLYAEHRQLVAKK